MEKGETCLSLWDTSDGAPDLGRRARFLAWAASRAAVFDVGTRERAEGCARALRERMSEDSSPIALVLTADDLALHPVPEWAALQDAAHRLGRAMAASHVEEATKLEAFARTAPQGRVAPWLALSPSTVLVVPRLSALAMTEALTQEIESVTGRGPFHWSHRP